MGGSRHKPEDGRVSLHDLLHVVPDFRSVKFAAGRPDLVESSDGFHTGIFSDFRVWLALVGVLNNVVGASSSIKQRTLRMRTSCVPMLLTRRRQCQEANWHRDGWRRERKHRQLHQQRIDQVRLRLCPPVRQPFFVNHA